MNMLLSKILRYMVIPVDFLVRWFVEFELVGLGSVWWIGRKWAELQMDVVIPARQNQVFILYLNFSLLLWIFFTARIIHFPL